MSDLFRFTLLGLGTGGIYALAALGLVLVHRGSGVVNFAQAAMGLVGAFAYYEVKVVQGLPAVVALVAGLAVSAFVGVLFHALVMRRLRESSTLAKIVATLALLVILQASTQLIYGPYPKLIPSLLPNGRAKVLGVYVGQDRIWIFAIAVVLTVALSLLYRFTSFGIATAAVAENPRAAAALAISPHTIAAANWALGASLGGLSIILLVPITGLHSGNVTMLIIPVLAAAIVGRLSSFPITMAAALGIGVSQSLVTRFADTRGLLTAIPFLLVTAVLLARGKVLVGKDEVLTRLPALGDGRPRVPALVAAFAVCQFLIWVVLRGPWLEAFLVQLLLSLLLLSVVVATGYAGQLSLATMAFASIGAGGASYFVGHRGWAFQWALLGGAAVTIPVGLLVGLAGVRARGISLAVVTLGFGITIESMVFGNRNIARKFMSFRGPRLEMFGIDIAAPTHLKRYAALAVVVLVVVALGIANLRRSRAGRRLIAVRANERAAAAMGVSVVGAKLYAFVLSGVIAGLAGVLLAYRAPFLRFGDFNFFNSILAVQYATLGGVGSLTGPAAGSTFASEALGPKLFAFLGSNVALTLSLVGNLALLVVLVVAPDGLVNRIGRALRSLLRLPTRSVPTPAAVPASEGPPETVNPTRLELSDVTVRFGGTVALDRFSMRVDPGEVVGLIGPNGAGKTTAIEVITGFVDPSAGTVSVGGHRIDRWSRERRARNGLARSFQSLELFDDLSVLENIQAACDRRDFGAYLTGLVHPGRGRLTASAWAAIHACDLDGDLAVKVTDLDYAKRRMVAVARAVASGQPVLLLDEPASGLDAPQTAQLGKLIRTLAKRSGIAVLLVEHNVDMVLRTCDRVYALNFGRCIGEGTPAEIRSNPGVIDAYLGRREETTSPVAVS